MERIKKYKRTYHLYINFIKNSNDKNYSSKDVIVKQISSTGEFTIPKSEYFDPKWTVSGFWLLVS